MGVKFSVLGGGDTIPNSFSDTFTRANTGGFWGPDWYIALAANASGSFNSSDVWTFFQINTNHGRMKSKGTATGGNSVGAFIIPRLPIGLFGQAQFVQARWIGGNGTVANPMRDGPAVMISPSNADAVNCYALIATTETSKFRLDRGCGFNNAPNIAGITPALAANDVIRLEARPGPTSNDLRIFLNGVQQGATFIDVSAPTQSGIPGFALTGADNGNGVKFDDWDDFSCGPL